MSFSYKDLIRSTASQHPAIFAQTTAAYSRPAGQGHHRRIARIRGEDLGIEFELPRSVERDLLIRKLFTSGFDTTAVTTSIWMATIGMLKRIWIVNSAAQPMAATGPAPTKEEKLAAETLVLIPLTNPTNLSALASERRIEAA